MTCNDARRSEEGTNLSEGKWWCKRWVLLESTSLIRLETPRFGFGMQELACQSARIEEELYSMVGVLVYVMYLPSWVMLI